ncbi:MAG: hypothetical protein HOC70_13535 [Gammaproteobacteria bacterium]|jgi:uncharacterized protein|nr:hypothetical protein [Gammaproteobacteria bacterium]MBT7369288.1 hypothetical protein [Gammaproteobacteria bacterium]
MRKFIPIVLILFVTACTAPTVDEKPGVQSQPVLETSHRGIDRLLLEAGRTIPPRSTELQLQAAALALEAGDHELAQRIVTVVESPYLSDQSVREYSLIGAELALENSDPTLAIKLLEDRRFQRLRLDTGIQIRTGKLRARAYRMGRSYLAGARELIYVDRLIPSAQKQQNHEDIFSTLMLLAEETLQRQAQLSITSEIRGWLSLAAMTKRYQHDPLRQLNALRDWQKVWTSHPAATVVPSSLQMLSRIVEERPENIALILPLQGELGKLGRAIRDGYIAAHFQLTPDATLTIHDSSQADILELVSQAEAAGAELIIGPLDRDRVTRLARHPLPMPIIALNRTLAGEINPNLYQFGLAPEDESIQVADQIIREGRFNGLVIAPDSEWGERNFKAFSEQFISEGGVIVDNSFFAEQRDYSDLVKSLLNVDTSEQRAANLRRITGERFEFAARRRQDIDFVFLLANAVQARGINPTLAFFYAEDIPVYATSHVHVTKGSRIDAIDMNGIRFCDIPWKLTNDDDIQKLIAETWPDTPLQLAPFFALGVDVHRLYPRLQQLKEYEHERIFGSTGILSLNENNVVNRTLMWAQFRDGEVSSVPMIFETGL